MQIHTALFLIGHAHPALPGHFPDAAVVPGVVVLDHVLALLAAAVDQQPQQLNVPQVKFVAPLLPGELAAIRLEIDGGRANFSVRRADTVIASGTLQWQSAS